MKTHHADHWCKATDSCHIVESGQDSQASLDVAVES